MDHVWNKTFFNHITWDLYTHWRARLPKTEKLRTPTKAKLELLYKDYLGNIRKMSRESDKETCNIRDELTCTFQYENTPPPPSVSSQARRLRINKNRMQVDDDSDGDEEMQEIQEDDDDDDDDDIDEQMYGSEQEEDDSDEEDRGEDVPICLLKRLCKKHNNEQCRRCSDQNLLAWDFVENCVDDQSVNLLGISQGYIWRWWESTPNVPGRSWKDAKKVNTIW